MKKFILYCLVITVLPVFSIEKIEPDPKALKLVSDFMNALTIADEAERLQAILPLVHDSLKTKDKKDLFSSVKQFSYKRAVDMIKLYKAPAEVSEVHKGAVSTIGYKELAEKGRRDKYFVKKKEGVNGMPAPIHVFIPENGGEPKIYDFGSL
ncbi:MAG TPA: hypothetical protein PK079_17290 [Leptospiraceae bacterium]|nr:hypothetical protein [Leptospiraceae bacterium]HMW05555.1 hypothetical protein [Leptospiraceae bacterium]HMX32866.1 hypothetical protein [Leptospiraceae bacterium]HMY31065.1 hypothetical protein [Leptospiraceae bacterium]HMZ66344.1 hypothetical protein [Leptospiraceae bacterium]